MIHNFYAISSLVYFSAQSNSNKCFNDKPLSQKQNSLILIFKKNVSSSILILFYIYTCICNKSSLIYIVIPVNHVCVYLHPCDVIFRKYFIAAGVTGNKLTILCNWNR